MDTDGKECKAEKRVKYIEEAASADNCEELV